MHSLKLKKEEYKELHAFRKKKERKKERKEKKKRTVEREFVFKTVCWCNVARILNICLVFTYKNFVKV